MEISRSKRNYRDIIKVSGVFGGVQVFNIIVNIIKSKFVAILLGPAGMGILGLYSSAITFIGYLSNFGLGSSTIKNIAEANSSGDLNRISKTIIILRRLVWITGILGSIIFFAGAAWLSQISFNNSDYTNAFRVLSIVMLVNQLSSGNMALLQGLRKLKHLANASMTGSLLGLLISVPIYYIWGINGIVPTIVVSSLVSFFRTWYFAKKIELQDVVVDLEQTISEGKKMLSMGVMISFSGAISLGVAYALRIFISKFGSLDHVGLYSAGFVILNTYVGIVFNAMGTDYYPKLSSISSSNLKCSEAMNQQAEISVLILAPILILFIVYIDWIIIILYSSKFLLINEMLHWAVLGVLFKAISWSVSYVFLAKSESFLFFWNELVANIYLIALNFLGYFYFGLRGLGVSFLISNILYMFQVYFISQNRYQFSLKMELIIIFIIQIILSSISLLVIIFFGSPYKYIIGTFIVFIAFYYSFYELDRRLGIKELINKFIKK